MAKRTERVTVMVTEKEYQYIKRRADLEHRSLSAHVWLMYRKGVNMEGTDDGTEMPDVRESVER